MFLLLLEIEKLKYLLTQNKLTHGYNLLCCQYVSDELSSWDLGDCNKA